MRRKLPIAPLVPASALAVVVACATHELPGVHVAVDGGSPDASVEPAPPAADPVVEGGADAKSPPVYDTNGWVRLDFDPAYDCGLYAAPSKDKLPPPIRWGDCDPILAQTGFSCRQMLFDWTPPSQPPGIHMGQVDDGWVDDSGRPWLLFSRSTPPGLFRLVGEADGPLHAAVVQTDRACSAGLGSLASGHYVFTGFRVDPQNSNTTYRWGAIGGAVDDVPAVLSTTTDPSRHYYAGSSSYAEIPTDVLRAWQPGGTPVATLDVTDPGSSFYFVYQGSTTFFKVGDLTTSRIKSFSTSAGLRDFISFGSDGSAAAADFGTDGKDMVWVEAHGPLPTQGYWQTLDIMTAAFTEDPSKIQKRRLRSELSFGTAPFKVACGYATHFVGSGGPRVVRLADGRSWQFDRVDGPPGEYNWIFNNVAAVTCDEVFLSAYRGYENYIVRIRLDSLGPGIPPD